MIEPTTLVTFTMPARQAQMVLQAINEQVQNLVALQQDIQRQCMAADQQPHFMPPRPNGGSPAGSEDIEERVSE